MQSSFDEHQPRVSSLGLSAVLLASIVLAITGACSDTGMSSRQQSEPSALFTPESVASFAGASEKRVFLSSAAATEGARRGLFPTHARSVLATSGALSYGEFFWDDAGVPSGPVTMRVDLDRQLISVFMGAHEIGTAVVAFGLASKETPRGRLPIQRKVRDYHSRTYDAPMPHSLFLREDGIAIHGSQVFDGKATNGCIGVPNAFAEKLFALAEEGDIVEVVGGEAAGYPSI